MRKNAQLRLGCTALLLGLIGGTVSRGMMIYMDLKVYDDKTAAVVRTALDSLKKNETDTVAMDVLVKQEAFSAKNVWGNAFEISKNPLRTEAIAWVRDQHSPATIIAAIAKGSDETAAWGMRTAFYAEANGHLTDKDEKEIVATARAGMKRWNAETRSVGVGLLAKWGGGGVMAFLKDKDEVVVATVIETFCYEHIGPPEEREAVALWMTKARDPAMMVACCDYWWMGKGGEPPMVTEDEAAIFKKWAVNSAVEVRSAVTGALERVARPENPGMIALLMELTHDKDANIRGYAVRSLRNANTPEVNAALVKWFESKESGLRFEALEVLGSFGQQNDALIVAAARSDADAGIRRNALYYLRHSGTAASAAALEAALNDPDKEVRAAAQEQWKWYKIEHAAKTAPAR